MIAALLPCANARGRESAGVPQTSEEVRCGCRGSLVGGARVAAGMGGALVSAGTMSIDESLASACEAVPGLQSGVLVLLPDGLPIGGVGEGSAFDREPLVRSTARCLTNLRSATPPTKGGSKFVEYAFVSDDQLVVILRGRRFTRVALALACSREANLAWVLSSTRAALTTIESTVDLAAFEL